MWSWCCRPRFRRARSHLRLLERRVDAGPTAERQALQKLIQAVATLENSFTAASIEVSRDQKVISTGAYARLRHPMYAGALMMLFGRPLALGSRWGLLLMIPMTLVLVLRLLDEEKFLARNLPGYTDYRRRVRYRLVPSIW
ncbi:MAG: phosphatidylethanolamine N-methyltransferase family protein [Chloroflexi bacterium]|nr:phosphatidylethanolamine N-methyltransferase family protein [Chloroflexota bacterium]